ncbi:MAG TPA: M14 family zinc carboxypeptidase [Candidatus Acidoferrales bacterium]|nr:M14 family zinc carboxypeptidase [Candidatus Acidoferrales bacterium]
MRRYRIFVVALFLAILPAALGSWVSAQGLIAGRDSNQPIDQAYTEKIHQYTTEPYFSSPLVDYLPASKTVPTPEAVLGDVAGAPGVLPYAEQVYQYMRMLAKASPRVRVYTIGQTEEGREMIAVAVSSEANLAHLEDNRAQLAKLADPRSIDLSDAEADRIAASAVPVYYITGTIHSPETGAPTALMELAYRLAVDDSQYIQQIRDRVITLITPVVEVDGRDRMVDIYHWHLAHPKENYPPLVYWGHYVAHDNNRDAMAATLKLTQNVMSTFITWKAQILHDLHESEPYLYDNTAGDGPFNAWVDPILTNEWEILGWRNVQDMTEFGMPGVFTHGNFDTWSPGYLMFIAAMHNGISRLYETFGNGGADTDERTLPPEQYSRTWYRQNPPLRRVLWSQRDNNNYEETGLLTSLHFVADSRETFLRNFYLKAKRSVLKPKEEGPAAYLLLAGDPRPLLQAELLEILARQGCEISRATQAFTITAPARPSPPPAAAQQPAGGEAKAPAAKAETARYSAGSYIIRMDQPYSRIADALLDHQYWSPSDPQKTPYDDTGWTFGDLFHVAVVRVTDPAILDVPMDRVTDFIPKSSVDGAGAVFAIADAAEPALATLRYRLKDASIQVAEEAFEAEGKSFPRGTFLVQAVDPGDLGRAIADLGLHAIGLAAAPSVASHPARAARIAILHTWLGTQTEGWWREALDSMKVPYAYINTQDVRRESDLRQKYDVILFPPVGRFASESAVVNGMPMAWGNPLPWKTTSLTPNIGKLDSTDDMRPGLGWDGVAHLQDFVRQGGALVTVMDTANLAVSLGLTPGVSVAPPQRLKIIGSVLRSVLVDAASPIAYGYGQDDLPVYFYQGPIFDLSNINGSRGFRRLGPEQIGRATGRGTGADRDFVVGRPPESIPAEPRVEPWQAAPVTDEQRRNGINVIPPQFRPRVIFRFAGARDLLLSGLDQGGDELAGHASIIDVPVGTGHVVLFSINPIYRGETRGSYALVLNTIMNFDHLDAGRKPAEK